MGRQWGFSLIELVVVIVILGILSAVAAPKFVDLSDDAYAARVDALYGAVRSASDLVHLKAKSSGETDSVSLASEGSGATINLVNGYPEGGAEGIINALDMEILAAEPPPTADSDWYYTTSPSGVLISVGKQSEACGVLYQTAAEGEAPSIVPQYRECYLF